MIAREVSPKHSCLGLPARHRVQSLAHVCLRYYYCLIATRLQQRLIIERRMKGVLLMVKAEVCYWQPESAALSHK